MPEVLTANDLASAVNRGTGLRLRQALVEADISRFKRVIENGLRSRTDQRRATEVAIAVNALNRMLDLGASRVCRLW